MLTRSVIPRKQNIKIMSNFEINSSKIPLRLKGGCGGEIEQVEVNPFLTVAIRNRFIRKIHLLLLVRSRSSKYILFLTSLIDKPVVHWSDLIRNIVFGDFGKMPVPEEL